MEKLIDKVIDNPINTFVVLIGISIVIYALSKLIPQPIKLITGLIQILLKEVKSIGRSKNALETSNILAITLFFLLTFAYILLTKSSSLYESIVGREKDIQTISFDIIFLGSLTFLITIISPVLIYRKKRFLNIQERVRRALN